MMFRDIKGIESFTKIDPITKGWSSDRKYYIETTDGAHLLLRVADIAEYDKQRAEYDLLKRIAAFSIPASRPVDFDLCDEGKSTYMMLTWLDGEDAEIILPTISDAEQYAIGLRAGALLRRIHSIPAPEDSSDWAERYFATMDARFEAFHRWKIHFDGDTIVTNFLEANRNLLRHRPQRQLHGDFHPGNLIIGTGGTLSVVDWFTYDFGGYGDPWQDFRSLEDYPQFTYGQLHGYFGSEPPIAFWQLFAYYTAASALTSIVWATHYGQDVVNEKLELNRNVLRWFDNMQNPVPIWYTP